MQIGVQATTFDTALEYAELAPELEAAGADYLWIGEAYGGDAISALGYAAARTSRLRLAPGILNVYSRSAGLIAMTMVGLDRLSSGRAACGLGSSGPQVVEALHGIPFTYPLSRLRAYTALCRQLWSGGRAEWHDRAVQVPAHEDGRPMRLLATPSGQIPLWWATLGASSVTATAESADGWLPFLFLPDRWERVWGKALEQGLARRDPALGALQVAADVVIAIGEEYTGAAAENALAGHRTHLALHVGGMGPRGANAYNTVAREYGFEDAAVEVQDLYLAGRRDEAERAVPEELLHGTALIGTPARVRERLAAYRQAGVTMLNVTFAAPDPAGQVAALRRICDNN